MDFIVDVLHLVVDIVGTIAFVLLVIYAWQGGTITYKRYEDEDD